MAHDSFLFFIWYLVYMKGDNKGKILELEKENKILKERINVLKYDLIHDELTGLKTRRYIVASSKEYLKSMFPSHGDKRKLDKKGKVHAGFLFCDVDFFKKVNDTFGHAVGDEVLRRISKAIELNVRDKDIVSRFGGEEILIFLFETSESEAEAVANKLKDSVENISFEKYPGLHVTISIGVSSTENEFIDESIKGGVIDKIFDEHVRRADSAVYVAKNTGRNKVVVWTPQIEDGEHHDTIRVRFLNAIKAISH